MLSVHSWGRQICPAFFGFTAPIDARIEKEDSAFVVASHLIFGIIDISERFSFRIRFTSLVLVCLARLDSRWKLTSTYSMNPTPMKLTTPRIICKIIGHHLEPFVSCG
jgi:hypothetical protein